MASDEEIEQTLDLIKKYESGGRNVPNYMYDPTHTAQGFWQITNSNWRNFAPKVGLDLGAFPNAMAASEEDQRKVARHILTQTPGGVRNWIDYGDEPLRKDLAGKGLLENVANTGNKKVADPKNIYADLSDEELDRVIDTLEKQDAQKKAAQTKQEAQQKPNWLERNVIGPVGRWSQEPEPEQPSFLHGGMIVPGLKQIAKGVTGYGEPEESRWRSGASDVMEGSARALTPAAIGATLGLGGGALAAGEGLGGAASALSPLLKGAAGAGLGGAATSFGASALSDDPETIRFAKDLGEFAGGYAGSKVPNDALLKLAKLAKNPGVQAGAIVVAAHQLGLPSYVGEAAATMRLGGSQAVRSRIGQFFRGGAEKGPEVNAPKPPSRVESLEMLRKGTITDQRYLEHEAARGSDPATAQEHLATARAKIADDIKKDQPAVGQMVATPEAIRNSTNPQGGPIQVTAPPGVQVNQSPPIQGPVPTGTVNVPGQQQPQGLTMGATGNLPPVNVPPGGPQAGTNPIGAPQPGSLGTVGPLPPSPARPPLTRPAPSGTPIGTQLNPPLTPKPQGIPSPGLGPVGPVRPPITGAAPSSTPLGIMPPSRDEQIVNNLADLAFAKKIAPPRTGNKAVLKGFARKLGLPEELAGEITGDHSKAARELYDKRMRALLPTANVPGTKTP